MKRNTPIPAYRRQREKGQDRAFVVLGGQRFHLGNYDTPESRQRYARVIAEWESSGGSSLAASDGLTVAELVASFWQFAESYYGKSHGGTTPEIVCFLRSERIRNVERLYTPTG